MKNRIITISREFGSGGRTIGKLTAQKLSIPCYDHELIEKLSEKSGFDPKYVSEQSEYTIKSRLLSNMFSSSRPYGGLNNQDYLWKIQRDIIIDIAQKESCVIVGRCADYILKDIADCLNVFVHADIDFKAERIVKIYGETSEKPEKRLIDKDKRRAAYYNYYTDSQWAKIQNYHIALNSGEIGIEKCAEIISSLY